MALISILLLAVGLSMDAFAVAVSRGFAMKRFNPVHALVIALFFGFFQAFMPLLGWFCGVQISWLVEGVDHWIAFVLLAIIGSKMIYEALNPDPEGAPVNETLDLKLLLILAVATSIDALAVGVTFAFLNVDIYKSCAIIGIITFLLSWIGVYLGKKVGHHFEGSMEIIGGVILIGIGIKTLFSHLL